MRSLRKGCIDEEAFGPGCSSRSMNITQGLHFKMDQRKVALNKMANMKAAINSDAFRQQMQAHAAGIIILRSMRDWY